MYFFTIRVGANQISDSESSRPSLLMKTNKSAENLPFNIISNLTVAVVKSVKVFLPIFQKLFNKMSVIKIAFLVLSAASLIAGYVVNHPTSTNPGEFLPSQLLRFSFITFVIITK